MTSCSLYILKEDLKMKEEKIYEVLRAVAEDKDTP